MSAQDFARAMLDKSLGFLLKQCQVDKFLKQIVKLLVLVHLQSLISNSKRTKANLIISMHPHKKLSFQYISSLSFY